MYPKKLEQLLEKQPVFLSFIQPLGEYLLFINMVNIAVL